MEAERGTSLGRIRVRTGEYCGCPIGGDQAVLAGIALTENGPQTGPALRRPASAGRTGLLTPGALRDELPDWNRYSVTEARSSTRRAAQP